MSKTIYESDQLILLDNGSAGTLLLAKNTNNTPKIIDAAELSPVEAQKIGMVLLRWANSQGKAPTLALEQLERRAILDVLELTHGSTTAAARLLGCSVRMVQHRVKQFRKEGLIK